MNTVISRFDSRHEADRAVSSLLRAGFVEEEITVSETEAPRWRDADALEPSSAHGRVVPVVGGMIGAFGGAFLVPMLLSIPIGTTTPSGALAAVTGALVTGVIGSRLASAVAPDDDTESVVSKKPEAPRVIGVRTLDGFASRARRILTQSGGTYVRTEVC